MNLTELNRKQSKSWLVLFVLPSLVLGFALALRHKLSKSRDSCRGRVVSLQTFALFTAHYVCMSPSVKSTDTRNREETLL